MTRLIFKFSSLEHYHMDIIRYNKTQIEALPNRKDLRLRVSWSKRGQKGTVSEYIRGDCWQVVILLIKNSCTEHESFGGNLKRMHYYFLFHPCKTEKNIVNRCQNGNIQFLNSNPLFIVQDNQICKIKQIWSQ